MKSSSNSIVEMLRKINNELYEIQETPIVTSAGKTAWHVTIVTSDGNAKAGGFAEDLDLARKIASCEFVERSLVSKYKKNLEKCAEWKLDTYPTACGFAAGFDRNRTVMRSILEALERWTLAQWVDDKYAMEEIAKPKLDLLSKHFESYFSGVRYFTKAVSFVIEEKVVTGYVGFLVGFTDKGAFPGSSCSLNEDHLWQHALLEAVRHLLISKNSSGQTGFPYDRIMYFSKNRTVAQNVLDTSCRNNWPVPVISFFKEEKVEEFILARTIFSGWRQWQEGPVSRFLY